MRQRDVLDGDDPPDADDDGDEADVGDDDEGRPKTMRDDMAAAAERVARPAAGADAGCAEIRGGLLPAEAVGGPRNLGYPAAETKREGDWPRRGPKAGPETVLTWKLTAPPSLTSPPAPSSRRSRQSWARPCPTRRAR